MTDDQKRIQLVERLAERFEKGGRAAVVERASERLTDPHPRQEEGPAPGPSTPGDRGAGKVAGHPEDDAADLRQSGDARRPAFRAPRTRYAELDLDALRTAGYVTPTSARSRITEEFRVIKRPLLLNAFSTRDGAPVRNGHVIMITSAVAGEGKTFVTINLAMSIALERDLNVLVIDTDVVKQDLTRRLGIESKEGLVDLLLDERLDVGDVLVRTNVPNLSLVSAGHNHPQSTELLASRRMANLVEEMASRYSDRVILIDTPPVLESTEPASLALHVGQIAMIVEADRTGRKTIDQAVSALNTTTNASFILNKTSRRLPWDHYGGYYGSYGKSRTD